ncbi:type VI secretion protein ImpB [Hellea sp.]|nr:type VI secretion protein ImpB [Hellea sp.]
MQPPCSINSLYIDFDAFFANVEKQIEPAIRSRPVGVTALGSEHSALITRCYMAKRAGITRGMRVSEAREACPDIAIRVARPDVYVDIHQRIIDEINRHVPVKKVWSIDEMECQLIGRERERAYEIGLDIQNGLRRNIGAYVTPSIGLAPNQFLAKVAAELEKPNGFVMLRAEDLPGPLLGLKLSDLPGISTGMEKRLNAAGILSVEDFWNISAKHARAIWGSVEGERMWAQLHGHRVERPPTTRRMFGHSRVLSGEFKDPKRAVDCLRLLTVKAANRLRRENYTAGAMSVSLRLQDKQRWTGETQFAPCRDDHSFLKHMHKLYDRGVAEMQPKRLAGVYVMLHKIALPTERGRDLFEDQDTRDWDTLTDVMDSFNRKEKKAVIHLGPRHKIPGGYAGAKIAFGRVPDAEDFF